MKCRMAYDSSGGPTMQTEVYCMVRNYETVSFCSYCQVCIWRPTDNISQYAYGIIDFVISNYAFGILDYIRNYYHYLKLVLGIVAYFQLILSFWMIHLTLRIVFSVDTVISNYTFDIMDCIFSWYCHFELYVWHFGLYFQLILSFQIIRLTLRIVFSVDTVISNYTFDVTDCIFSWYCHFELYVWRYGLYFQLILSFRIIRLTLRTVFSVDTVISNYTFDVTDCIFSWYSHFAIIHLILRTVFSVDTVISNCTFDVTHCIFSWYNHVFRQTMPTVSWMVADQKTRMQKKHSVSSQSQQQWTS